jgi:DNA-directed RNA polymerase subunit RPC12/RpoP
LDVKVLLICCKCGKKIIKPIKKLANSVFVVEVYKCRKCKATYKEAHYNRRVIETDALAVCN